MNLVSCRGCGLVYNTEEIEVPPIYNDEGEMITENCEWAGEDYAPTFRCVGCNVKVFF